jgi:hypothetical protein
MLGRIEYPLIIIIYNFVILSTVYKGIVKLEITILKSSNT